MELQIQIKNLRVHIDSLAQLTDTLEQPQVLKSNEIKSCIKKLLFSKAWLGKCMGELGVETPYKNDGNRKEINDIEPTDSVANKVTDYPLAPVTWETGTVNKTYIEKVDYLRQKIELVSNEIKSIITDKSFTREFSIARTNAYTYSCEARFYLGFELERLKKEYDSQPQQSN